MTLPSLPIPDFFNPDKVSGVWRVPYQDRASQALAWANKYNIKASSSDKVRTCLLIIDAQNTFCLPEFELFVEGAVADNIRLCEFIYRHLNQITEIIPTLDTHTALQIFHPIFWVNESGENPPPMTMISLEDVEKGVWKINPNIAVDIPENYGLHYVKKLTELGKYLLTIWPYHSLVGGIGHSLVSAVEEAVFFHSLARGSQTHFEIKGNHPLTENYSVLSPEVQKDSQGEVIADKNSPLIKKLLQFDKIFIAGQAKSHCVAWTIEDLLNEIQLIDATLAQKVYLLEDCSSPVVVPGVIDFTQSANAAYQRFAAAGMKIIQSTNPL